jgi:catechol 2,3-dioxygenase-like lactoylglutathione lyase family enzyme
MITRSQRRGLLACAFGLTCSLAATAPAQTPLPRVHHILFEVSHLDASIAFYRDHFGLKVVRRMGDFAVLEADNVGVYLWAGRWSFEGALRPSERNGLGVYPHLEVRDVRGKLSQLRAAGVHIVRDANTEDWGTEAFVADPDGYVWALVSINPPAPSPLPQPRPQETHHDPR